MVIVNLWKPLTIITKKSILDVTTVLDPLLDTIYLDANDHNRTEEVLAFKIGEGLRTIRDLRIISWLMKVRCRFSQITFRDSRPQLFCKKIWNYLCWSFFLINLQASGLKIYLNVIQNYRYDTPAPVFLKTSILQNVCEWLLLYFRTAILGYMRNIHWKILKSFFNKVYIPIKALQRLSPENFAKPWR